MQTYAHTRKFSFVCVYFELYSSIIYIYIYVPYKRRRSLVFMLENEQICISWPTKFRGQMDTPNNRKQALTANKTTLFPRRKNNSCLSRI